jgi:predicted nucleotidyltransferase
MSNKIRATIKVPTQTSFYRGSDVPMSVIRQFAHRVAERFRPEKIILFGSHAYGTPHADSDVDILVVMPARSLHGQAVKIRAAVPRPFAMDLIIRTPEDLRWRLANSDMFHTEIVTKGKILYKAGDTRMGGQGRRRLSGSRRTTKKSKAAS